GPCLARGYLGDPVLTAGRFGPDPFGPPGARLYRTGDRGRWGPDGQVDFLGRVDHMVKVRGYRIELGEIETALERSPDVQRAKVVVAPGPDGNDELRAFAAAAAGSRPNSVELRTHLESVLPRYMVPTVITVLDELPMTSRAKIDSKALLALPRAATPRRPKRRPPQTPLQQEVAAVWAEVLRTDVADLADDFFLLGGNQQLALRVLVGLQERLLVQVPLQTLIRTPKLEAFCAHVDKAFAELAGEVDLGALIVDQTDGVQP
ncbi:MAG TPA: phosphopantetheine-binding protein, partial [Streptosporangiaceae bacterium]|nr:phosphopantetheine-binding protein [Streptosporangiaceae bacterium]